MNLRIHEGDDGGRFVLGGSTMIGQIVSHYKILEGLGEGGMSQNHPRTLCVSGCDFEDPPSFWRRLHI